MKKLLVTLAVMLALGGCATTTLPPKVETVYVDKPVPFIPKPPDIPAFQSEVDKLTLNDASDPGKVGQAYKYDMTQLRSLQKIYQGVLDQYRAGSQNFDEVNKQIGDLIKQINGASATK